MSNIVKSTLAFFLITATAVRLVRDLNETDWLRQLTRPGRKSWEEFIIYAALLPAILVLGVYHSGNELWRWLDGLCGTLALLAEALNGYTATLQEQLSKNGHLAKTANTDMLRPKIGREIS
jgi:hypothetical protein